MQDVRQDRGIEIGEVNTVESTTSMADYAMANEYNSIRMIRKIDRKEMGHQNVQGPILKKIPKRQHILYPSAKGFHVLDCGPHDTDVRDGTGKHAEHHRDSFLIGHHRDVRLFHILPITVVTELGPTFHVGVGGDRCKVQGEEVADRSLYLFTLLKSVRI